MNRKTPKAVIEAVRKLAAAKTPTWCITALKGSTIAGHELRSRLKRDDLAEFYDHDLVPSSNGARLYAISKVRLTQRGAEMAARVAAESV